MNRTTVLLSFFTLLILGGAGFAILNFTSKNGNLVNPQLGKQVTPAEIKPSESLKTFEDPAGFSFNYPDNLSVVSSQTTDNNTYTDLRLTASGVDGSLYLKIVDSKLKSINDWLKDNKLEAAKEVKLGTLKAMEVRTEDKILLGSLDQGILFTIEVPFEDGKEFWTKVYDKVVADFSFAPPAADAVTSDTGYSDFSFEGEEVVE